MSKKVEKQNDTNNNDIEVYADRQEQSWGERHFASIMGGGAFALLALITLMMYILNS